MSLQRRVASQAPAVTQESCHRGGMRASFTSSVTSASPKLTREPQVACIDTPDSPVADCKFGDFVSRRRPSACRSRIAIGLRVGGDKSIARSGVTFNLFPADVRRARNSIKLGAIESSLPWRTPVSTGRAVRLLEANCGEVPRHRPPYRSRSSRIMRVYSRKGCRNSTRLAQASAVLWIGQIARPLRSERHPRARPSVHLAEER